VLAEIDPCHDKHVHPVLISEQQVCDQPAAAAEEQLVEPTIRIVGVERLTAFGHQFQHRQGAGERDGCRRRQLPDLGARERVDIERVRHEGDGQRPSSALTRLHGTLPGRGRPIR
jgi:hypothetical protein